MKAKGTISDSRKGKEIMASSKRCPGRPAKRKDVMASSKQGQGRLSKKIGSLTTPNKQITLE